jgi:hypothetical protein
LKLKGEIKMSREHTFKGYHVMLCSVRVVALVHQVITGITSSLLAMRDTQPRVRCAAAFVTIYIPLLQENQLPIAHLTMFCLQPDNQQDSLSINDEFPSEKFGSSVLSTDPPWPDLRLNYAARVF